MTDPKISDVPTWMERWGGPFLSCFWGHGRSQNLGEKTSEFGREDMFLDILYLSDFEKSNRDTWVICGEVQEGRYKLSSCQSVYSA